MNSRVVTAWLADVLESLKQLTNVSDVAQQFGMVAGLHNYYCAMEKAGLFLGDHDVRMLEASMKQSVTSFKRLAFLRNFTGQSRYKLQPKIHQWCAQSPHMHKQFPRHSPQVASTGNCPSTLPR